MASNKPNKQGFAKYHSAPGFAPILILVIVGIIVVVGGLVVWMMGQERSGKSAKQRISQQLRRGTDSESQEWPALWRRGSGDCDKDSPAEFSASPINLDEITIIQPIGELAEGHIIPGDHIGINYDSRPNLSPLDVHALADGYIVTIERHSYTPPPGYSQDLTNYHVYIEHTCTFFMGYVHLTELAPEILAASQTFKKLDSKQMKEGEVENAWDRVPVKAGQVIGTASSFGLLGMVTVDLNVTNSGYLKPETYAAENWRIHSVSPFEYFKEPLQTQLFAKNPRSAEPRGGKIDFDVDGRLIGGWFREGSGGFRDFNVPARQCGNWPCPYWDGHLAFVYDYIDPQQIRISIGIQNLFEYQAGADTSTPFGVKGNTPDPADIGVGDGIIKYEIVPLRDTNAEHGVTVTSQSQIFTENDDTIVLGTLLVQMQEEGTIKVEVFPGKTASQVSSFTSAANIYER